MSVGLVVLQAMASLTSVAMCLGSAPIVYRIHKAQDTGDAALLPLVGLLVNCHMLMMYGLVTGDLFPLFATYAFGEVLAVVYTAVYFRWTKQRRYAAISITAALSFILAGSLFVILAKIGVLGISSSQLNNFTGYFMAVGSVLLYISPFETIARVLRTRSAASIPFWMCLAGATSNTLWVIDGLLVGDMFVFVLGAVCAFFAAIQVVLYFVFYPKQSAQISSEAVQIQIQGDGECGDLSVHAKDLKHKMSASRLELVREVPPNSPVATYTKFRSPSSAN